MTVGGWAERPAESVHRASSELLDREMRSILKRRSKLLQGLSEVGIKSRIPPGFNGPEEVVLEQVRREMDDLAHEMEPLLPSLPGECQEMHRKLRTLAAECNSLASRCFQLRVRRASHGP